LEQNIEHCLSILLNPQETFIPNVAYNGKEKCLYCNVEETTDISQEEKREIIQKMKNIILRIKKSDSEIKNDDKLLYHIVIAEGMYDDYYRESNFFSISITGEKYKYSLMSFLLYMFSVNKGRFYYENLQEDLKKIADKIITLQHTIRKYSKNKIIFDPYFDRMISMQDLKQIKKTLENDSFPGAESKEQRPGEQKLEHSYSANKILHDLNIDSIFILNEGNHIEKNKIQKIFGKDVVFISIDLTKDDVFKNKV